MKELFMHPVLLSLIAVTFYALNAVLIERFLKVNHPLWAQLIGNAIIPLLCIVFIGGLRMTGNTIELKTPALQTWMFIGICGLVYFLGNCAFYYAYANGGSVTTVTTILCLLPVISTLFALCLGGKIPTTNEIAGSALIAMGILLFLRK